MKSTTFLYVFNIATLHSFVALLVAISPVAKASSSSSSYAQAGTKSYNVYNYDQTTPQFTPDGRLLQVEYASSAADHSSPLLALSLPLVSSIHDQNLEGGTRNNQPRQEQALVLITAKATETMEKDNDSNSVTTPIMACHNRLVIIPSSSSPDKDIIVAMSGVLADCTALLQLVWKETSRHYQMYHTSMSVQQISQVMADACQRHSFGGGIRPYGSTMLVCGMGTCTGSHDDTKTNPLQIVQTDPSGAIVQPPSPNKSQNSIRIRHNKKKNQNSSNNQYVRWMVGGTRTVQLQIQKELEHEFCRLFKLPNSGLSSSPSVGNVILGDAIALAASVLLKHQGKGVPLSRRNNSRPNPKSRQPDGMQGTLNEMESSASRPALEVVVMSPTFGVHRLTDLQLEGIWKRVQQL